jgi:hypothetical protein
MLQRFALLALFALAAASLLAEHSWAQKGEASRWGEPVLRQCLLLPGEGCQLDLACPAERPFVVAGGGGLLRSDRPEQPVALTENRALSEALWRVGFRRLVFGDSAAQATAPPEEPLEITIVARIECSTEGPVWVPDSAPGS